MSDEDKLAWLIKALEDAEGDLLRFAALVRADERAIEREACAQECRRWMAACDAAAAIRKRSEP